MSNLLRKRRPTTTGGTETRPSSRTGSNCHHIRKLTFFHSEETAAHRCGRDTSRHREGVSRCLSTSQVVPGRHQCTHKTLQSAFPSNRTTISLMDSSQEYQDVQEKLRDLIPWLTNLKDNLMTPCTNDNREEVERRERLIRYLSHFTILLTQVNRMS